MAQRPHLEILISLFGIRTGWTLSDIQNLTLSQAIAYLYALGKQQRGSV